LEPAAVGYMDFAEAGVAAVGVAEAGVAEAGVAQADMAEAAAQLVDEHMIVVPEAVAQLAD